MYSSLPTREWNFNRVHGGSFSLSLVQRRSLRFESSAKVIGWKGRKRSKARILVAARFVGIIVLIKLDYLPPRAQRKEIKRLPLLAEIFPRLSKPNRTRTTTRWMSFSPSIKMIRKLFYRMFYAFQRVVTESTFPIYPLISEYIRDIKQGRWRGFDIILLFYSSSPLFLFARNFVKIISASISIDRNKTYLVFQKSNFLSFHPSSQKWYIY